MENFEFVFDIDKLLKYRTEFKEFIQNSIGIDVDEKSIKIYCKGDEKLILYYQNTPSSLQHLSIDNRIIVTKDCYPKLLPNTTIQFNSEIYDVKFLKKQNCDK